MQFFIKGVKEKNKSIKLENDYKLIWLFKVYKT